MSRISVIITGFCVALSPLFLIVLASIFSSEPDKYGALGFMFLATLPLGAIVVAIGLIKKEPLPILKEDVVGIRSRHFLWLGLAVTFLPMLVPSAFLPVGIIQTLFSQIILPTMLVGPLLIGIGLYKNDTPRASATSSAVPVAAPHQNNARAKHLLWIGILLFLVPSALSSLAESFLLKSGTDVNMTLAVGASILQLSAGFMGFIGFCVFVAGVVILIKERYQARHASRGSAD